MRLLVSIQNPMGPFMEDLIPLLSFSLSLVGEHVQHSEQMTQLLEAIKITLTHSQRSDSLS